MSWNYDFYTFWILIGIWYGSMRKKSINLWNWVCEIYICCFFWCFTPIASEQLNKTRASKTMPRPKLAKLSMSLSQSDPNFNYVNGLRNGYNFCFSFIVIIFLFYVLLVFYFAFFFHYFIRTVYSCLECFNNVFVCFIFFCNNFDIFSFKIFNIILLLDFSIPIIFFFFWFFSC